MRVLKALFVKSDADTGEVVAIDQRGGGTGGFVSHARCSPPPDSRRDTDPSGLSPGQSRTNTMSTPGRNSRKTSARRSTPGLGGPPTKTAIGPLMSSSRSGVRPRDSCGSGGGNCGSTADRTYPVRRWANRLAVSPDPEDAGCAALAAALIGPFLIGLKALLH